MLNDNDDDHDNDKSNNRDTITYDNEQMKRSDRTNERTIDIQTILHNSIKKTTVCL